MAEEGLKPRSFQFWSGIPLELCLASKVVLSLIPSTQGFMLVQWIFPRSPLPMQTLNLFRGFPPQPSGADLRRVWCMHEAGGVLGKRDPLRNSNPFANRTRALEPAFCKTPGELPGGGIILQTGYSGIATSFFNKKKHHQMQTRRGKPRIKRAGNLSWHSDDNNVVHRCCRGINARTPVLQ